MKKRSIQTPKINEVQRRMMNVYIEVSKIERKEVHRKKKKNKDRDKRGRE